MDDHPPAVQMVQLLAGFQVSQALYVAAKLSIADELLAGPRSAESLATAVGADVQSLRRLMRTLSSLGVFRQTDSGEFEVTPLGATLADGTPGSMRDLALMWMETHYEPFGGLLEGVRRGECAATTVYGKPFFPWLAEQPDQVERFSRAMANLTNGIKAGAIASYDFSGAGRIVDLGAADGAVLARILTATPGTEGIAFDLPHVVEQAQAHAGRDDLGDRLRFEPGNFFDAVPTGADTYLMSMVLHDWDDQDATRLLSNIASAAPPGARVLAFELVNPADDTPHMAKMIDLTMLAITDGRERTEDEHRRIFEAAGLTYTGALTTPTPISILNATV